jgi:ABC-type multidrug transport system fused ATPase/permease subunit
MAVGEETALTSIILLYFVAASAVVYTRRRHQESQSEQEQEQGKDQIPPADDKKEDKAPCPRLHHPILCATVLTILASILESITQGILIGGLSKAVNDQLFADLLFLMTWIILLLGFIQAGFRANYSHIGPCTLSLLVRALYTPTHRSLTFETPQKRLLSISFAAQLAGIVLTIALTLLQRCLPLRPAPDDSPESQPLLGNDPSSDAATKDAGDDDEDIEDDSEIEKSRKGIRHRPFYQYLMAFKIFTPFMWPASIRQWGYFAGMCVCSVAQRAVNILTPLTLGAVINHLDYISVPWQQISVYIFLTILSSSIGIPLAERILNLILSNQQSLALNRAAYDHIMDLGANFQDSKSSASVWQSIHQARSVVSLFHDIVFEVSPALFDLAAGFLVLSSVFGGYMGLLLTTTIVSFLWLTIRALAPRADLQRKYRDAYIKEYYQLVESSSNWYTCAHHGQIPREKGSFRTRGQATQDAQMTAAYFNFSTRSTRYLIHMIAFFGACSLAAIQIARSEQKVGAFVMLTAYWNQMSYPLTTIVDNINRTFEKLIDAERLLVLLEREANVQDGPNASDYVYMGGAVAFENVHFSYDGKRNASEGITFRSNAGSKTALVGVTGAGKSSTLKLLFRFHDPEKGRILLDGQDLKDIKIDSFRKHFGVVPQDPALFNTTVLDNVRYPNFTASEEAVQEACKAVSLHDKILTFSKGYMTKVGERGCRLSGGELQRLAIARAIVKKPDILLLDEATSSVDSITESKIQESLDKLCAGKTTFVIAHRLSTILKSDQILVIDEGKLVESGTHDELLEKKGAYHKLWTTQLKLQSEVEKKAAEEKAEKEEDLILFNDLRKSEDESTKLIRVTSDGNDLEKKSEPQSKEQEKPSTSRGRRQTVKDHIENINRRLSASPSASPKRDSKANSTQPTSTNSTQPSSTSQSRNRLTGNATDFVPRKQGSGQHDGAGESGISGRQLSRRRAQSEPAKEDDDSSSEEGTDEVDEDNPARYSRIPRRNRDA